MPVSSNKDIDFSQIDSDYDIGHFEEALWALQDLQKTYPDDGGVLYRLGLIHEGMLDFSAARKAYKKSANRLSEASLAVSHLGNLLYKMHQYKPAIGAFKDLQSLQPKNAYASYMLGMVYMNTAQYSDSITSFEQAVEIDASFKQKGIYGQGLSYVRMGQNEKGQALLKESIALDPEADVALIAKKELANAERLASISYLSFFGLYGFKYDSNVVLKPSESPNIPLITGNSDFEHTFLLALNYAKPPKEGVGHKFAARFYQSIHNRLRTFDITDLGVTWTPYMKFNDQILLFMDASADQILLNYRSYLSSYSLKPTLTYNYNKQLQLMFSVTSRWENYNIVVNQPNLDQDAWIHTARLQLFVFTEDHRSSLQLGGHRTVNSSRGSDWSYHGYGIDGGFDVAMPYLEKLKLNVHGAAERNVYQNLIVGQGRFRRDSLYDASASLSYPFSYANVGLMASYTHNVSTLDVFSYVRMTTGFNVSRSF
ncbi:MAG: tetratricopeptide repeat protein [Mariprofundus sp.]|nr:tetratricopeptide repeat protein [Mariprofundus sp.]